MIGNPELDYMSWALNWGLAYDLPNETWYEARVLLLESMFCSIIHSYFFLPSRIGSYNIDRKNIQSHWFNGVIVVICTIAWKLPSTSSLFKTISHANKHSSQTTVFHFSLFVSLQHGLQWSSVYFTCFV